MNVPPGRESMSSEPIAIFLIPGDIRRQTGGSLYNRKLAISLKERGFQLRVVQVPDLPYFAGLLAGFILFPFLLLRLATNKYDIIIEDGWVQHTTLLFNIARRIFGKVPLVVIVHQLRSGVMKLPAIFIARMIERITLGPAQLIVTVSNFISDEVERLIGKSERIAVAPPGSAPLLDETWDQHTTTNMPLCLLFVGNCTRLKGLDHLIAALGLIQDLPVRLDVVGDVSFEPRYHKELVRQAKSLGVIGRVAFHGAVQHEGLGSFYSRADIFTFPSLYEGFGIVLAEAMHAGLPIVATRVGPADEILREGENALIVPAADSTALAEAIRLLATDAPLREAFGRRSRELAGSLPTWEQTCRDVCHRIEMLLQPKVYFGPL